MMYKKCEESRKRHSSSKSEIYVKPSKSSNKSSSSSIRKISEDKLKTKWRSQSAPFKPPKQESGSHIVSKASSSSVMRRSLTGKKSSIASCTSKEKRSSSTFIEILPEYSEAWEMYKVERKNEYENFLKLHEKNETEMKSAFYVYKTEMGHSRKMAMDIEKIKEDLLMSKMTRELQNISAQGNSSMSNFEQCLVENLRKAEKNQMEKREIILTTQATFKVCLEVCKRLKRDLERNFDLYCKEKYHMPTAESPVNEIFMHINDLFLEEENDVNELLPDNTEMEKFKQYKQLITKELKKKKIYQLKQREWTFY